MLKEMDNLKKSDNTKMTKCKNTGTKWIILNKRI